MHYDFYESVFSISERLSGKPILLYGLNNITKSALIFLAHLGIPVYGFLIKEKEKVGITYLGKVCISETDLNNSESDFCVLRVWMQDQDADFENLICEKITLFSTEKKILIYGAGMSGEALLNLLSKCNAQVMGVFDRRANDVTFEIHNIQVRKPETISEENKDCVVVVAINDKKVCAGVRQKISSYGFGKIVEFNSDEWVHLLHYNVYICRKDEYAHVIDPPLLHYFDYMHGKNKKIYLYAKDINYLVKILLLMKTLGFTYLEAISNEFEKCALIDNCHIYGSMCLTEKQKKDTIVFVLQGEKTAAEEYIKSINAEKSMFIYHSNMAIRLDRATMFDIHTGHIDKNCYKIIPSSLGNKDCAKIAIMGSSQSSLELFYEDTWSDRFCEEVFARTNCAVLSTATIGFTSGQQLIQLIRDIIWKKPDIIIDVSGGIEIQRGKDAHFFASPYHRMIYQMLLSNQKKPRYAGVEYEDDLYLGVSNEDAADVWITYKRMMRAICEEFDIKYYCFLEPVMFMKSELSQSQVEIIEHLCIDDDVHQKSVEKYYKKIREYSNCVSWMYDDLLCIPECFEGEVFWDEYHYHEECSKAISDKIMDIVF